MDSDWVQHSPGHVWLVAFPPRHQPHHHVCLGVCIYVLVGSYATHVRCVVASFVLEHTFRAFLLLRSHRVFTE